jgi:hypothetical protein
MSVLKVKCPETGREISTGIEIDPESFAALPDKLPVSNCPLCGLDHAWLKCDARFVEDLCLRPSWSPHGLRPFLRGRGWAGIRPGRPFNRSLQQGRSA